MLRRPLPLALLIGLPAQGLFAFRVTVPGKLVFDEIHYVPAARTLLALEGPANTEHPLVAKALIALGIHLFGDGALGWRALSTLAGTATVLAIFAVAWLLYGRPRTAALAALLAVVNFTLFVQARIAMLDGFMAAFVVGGLALLLWAHRAGSARAAWTRWIAAGVLFGLAIGTKWAALPWLAFAGAGWLLVRLTGRRAVVSLPLAALPVLGAVAGVTYLATFAPAFFYARDPLTWSTLLPFQAEMWARQTQVLPPHDYQSAWWSWPLMLRPIWYLYEPVDGAQRGIFLLGNPAVMWGGLVAVAACGWGGWRDRSWPLAAPALMWAAGWLVFAVIPKSLGFFYYYYLPSLVLPVAIAAAFDRFDRGRKWDEAFAAGAVVTFAWFYPILAALPLAGAGGFSRWTWFPGWV